MQPTINSVEIPEPPIAKFLFANTRIAWLWFIIRLFVGWQWLQAGWEKLHSTAWIGNQSGMAIKNFLNAATLKAGGPHPDVSGWYAFFITHGVLQHTVAFSYFVTYGEIIVGILLIIGLLTGIAAFFGIFMNFNYLFAGTVSINPILALLGLLLMFAWRTAGWYGADRYVLPLLGTPWQAGKLFNK